LTENIFADILYRTRLNFFGLKRTRLPAGQKSVVLYPIENFFELHPPLADGMKKRQKWGATRPTKSFGREERFFSQLKKFKRVHKKKMLSD